MDIEKLEGKFIVLDGPDGSGKSTQVGLLDEALKQQGLETLLVRDPGGTAIGEQIRAILLGTENVGMSVRCELLLYMASRAQLYSQSIAPALEEGRCVICDRWVSSTYAYQAVAGGIGREQVLEIAGICLERTWPDLTVIVDVPAELGLQRIGASPDRMEQKPLSFHQDVRAGYLGLARIRQDIQVVNGVGRVEQVHHRIYEVISEYVDS